MAEFIEIPHSGNPVSLTSFSETHQFVFNRVINETGTQAVIEPFSIDDLLNYEGNKERILIGHRPEDDSNASAEEILVRSGVVIRVPNKNITKESIATTGTLVVPNEDFNAFIDDRIKEIILDPSYIPLNVEDVYSSGKTFRITNNISVWVWCKSLGGVGRKQSQPLFGGGQPDSASDRDQKSLNSGKIYNLTPFVRNVTTNNGDNGGNFQVELAPVSAEWDESLDHWVFKRSSAEQYWFNNQKNIVVRDTVATDTGTTIDRVRLLFNNIISPNDIVFIKFETLELDKSDRDKEASEQDLDNLIIHEREIPNKNYDMIGLVDKVGVNETSGDAGISLVVQGRCPMKLLIEDGTYFYPLDFAKGEQGGFNVDEGANTGKHNRPFQRIVTGELMFFNAFTERDVNFTMNFILNILSTVEVCSPGLFFYYEESKKTKKYDYAKVLDDGTLEGLKKVDAAGIWQIIKLVIDERVAGRQIVDSSIRSDQGSLLNYINKICQQPFVEFYGDTFGDLYYFIARKPPYTQASYVDLVKNTIIDIDENDINQQSLDFDEQEVYSWYRIIPIGNFFGETDIAKAVLPAIFFEEYAKIWGSRPLEVVSNYIDFQGIRDENDVVNFDTATQAAIQDLGYIIESHAYLPFTRKGTIVLKGDRRIRRGIAVRHGGTGEVYHVDNVTQTFSVSEVSTERITSINVSRGMVEEYMENDKFNYFNIIDLDKDDKGVSQSGNFKVNPDVFRFFLKRKQFRK